MKIFLFWLIVSLSFGNCLSQKSVSKKTRIDIEALIARENYNDALVIIQDELVTHDQDQKLKLQQGICLLNIDGNVEKAVDVFKQVAEALPLKGKKQNDAIEARFYLGQALHLQCKFIQAKEVFDNLLSNLSVKQTNLLSIVEREIAYNDNALQLIQKPVNFRISNLGKQINTPYDEHSPVLSADETILIFTSDRIADTLNPKAIIKEDIYLSEFRDNQWTEAQRISSIENKNGANATVSLSADGKTLLIYQYDGISGDIYQCTQTFEGWTSPEKLPAPINTAFNETHASFSADGNTLFFASDRPGGFGKSDIYMIRRLPDGEWSKVINLGPAINTSGDEDSPFIHPDNKTLYFASTEHTSMGGFDIFKSTQNDSLGWSTPENIGFPINTPDDDLFYNPSVDGMRVYFSSRRADGYGKSDLYLIEFDENDARSMAVVAGFVFNQDNKPTGEVNITVSDAISGDFVGVYRPNPVTGKYVLILPTGKSFKLNYLGASEEIVRTIEVPKHANYTSGNWAHYLDPVMIQVP